MRGVVSASTHCNREMSVLARATERQPGSGVQVCILHTAPKVQPRNPPKRKKRTSLSVFSIFGGDAGSWTPVLKAFTGTFYMFISRLNFSHFGTWANLRLMSPKWQPTYRTLGWCCLFFWCRLPREQKTSGRHADLNYAARAKPMLDFIELFFAFNFSVPF